MPIYDFKCQECGNVFERISRWDSSDIQVCPRCMSDHTEIQFPTPPIVRSGTLFDRQRVPNDFKQGILEPIKKKYSRYGYNPEAIKV